MEAVSGVTNSIPADESRAAKLARAAHQFEAVLLNQLLGSLQETFSALGKHKSESGSDHYQYLGMQALASSIAAGGGVGIAEMIIHNVMQRENPAADAAAKPQKSLSGFFPRGSFRTFESTNIE